MDLQKDSLASKWDLIHNGCTENPKFLCQSSRKWTNVTSKKGPFQKEKSSNQHFFLGRSWFVFGGPAVRTLGFLRCLRSSSESTVLRKSFDALLVALGNDREAVSLAAWELETESHEGLRGVSITRWWFHFFLFSPLPGEMLKFD